MLELFPYSHCFDVDVLFSISYWNVHGLNEGKLEEIAYMTSSCKYDIICLSKKMTGESPCNLLCYSWSYIVKPLKLTKTGRPSGGMFIFTKPTHRKAITVLKQSTYSTWMKLDKRIFNFVPAGKASNKIVFVCKSYYFECLIQELGINSNTPSNTIYKPTSFDKDEILANHRSFMTSLSIPSGKESNIYPIYIGYLNSIRHHTKKGT